MQETKDLFAELEPLVKGVGMELLELSARKGRGSYDVRAVVYAPSGTGIAECSKAHRLIYPKLQLLLGTEDVGLEVASPGIDRILKSPREYAVFAGKGLKVMLHGEGEWLSGRLLGPEGEGFVLDSAGERRVIEFARVAKARLDPTQEGD